MATDWIESVVQSRNGQIPPREREMDYIISGCRRRLFRAGEFPCNDPFSPCRLPVPNLAPIIYQWWSTSGRRSGRWWATSRWPFFWRWAHPPSPGSLTDWPIGDSFPSSRQPRLSWWRPPGGSSPNRPVGSSSKAKRTARWQPCGAAPKLTAKSSTSRSTTNSKYVNDDKLILEMDVIRPAFSLDRRRHWGPTSWKKSIRPTGWISSARQRCAGVSSSSLWHGHFSFFLSILGLLVGEEASGLLYHPDR